MSATNGNTATVKPGDLAIVIREKKSHPCNRLGRIVTVSKIMPSGNGRYAGKIKAVKCYWCGWQGKRKVGNGTFMVAVVDGGLKIAVRDLKRIPPLDELDDVKCDEEITA